MSDQHGVQLFITSATSVKENGFWEKKKKGSEDKFHEKKICFRYWS